MPDSDLTIVGNTFNVYRGGKMVEWRELQTNQEIVTLLKDTFGIQVPDRYQNFLYRQEE